MSRAASGFYYSVEKIFIFLAVMGLLFFAFEDATDKLLLKNGQILTHTTDLNYFLNEQNNETFGFERKYSQSRHSSARGKLTFY